MYNFPVYNQFKLKPYENSYVLGCNTIFMASQAASSINLKIKAGIKTLKYVRNVSLNYTESHPVSNFNLGKLTWKTANLTKKTVPIGGGRDYFMFRSPV